jgi:hypothetical protein
VPLQKPKTGLATGLAEFGPPGRLDWLLSVLTAADMTTGPDGVAISPTARIEAILNQYSPDDIVHRAVSRSGRSLIDTSHAVLDR